MKHIMIALMVACLIQQAYAETPTKILILDFVAYADGRIGNVSYSIDYGIPTVPSTSETDYLLRVYDGKNKVIYSAYFYLGLEIISLGGLQERMTKLDSTNVRLRLPCYETAKKAVITIKGKDAYSLDLSQLCNYNGLCDSEENRLSCFEDCREDTKRDYCDPSKDGVCDRDCLPEWDPDCLSKTTNNESSTSTTSTLPVKNAVGINEQYMIYVFILVFVALVLLFMYKATEKKKIEKKRKEFISWKEEQEKLKQDGKPPATGR
jgi:hypothetical protein